MKLDHLSRYEIKLELDWNYIINLELVLTLDYHCGFRLQLNYQSRYELDKKM